MNGESWGDEPAGRLVRPFAVARGRTRPQRQDLDLITLIVAITAPERRRHEPEYAAVLRACAHPISVAEVSAALDLPLVVVKILLSDLIERGDVIFRSAPRTTERVDDPVILRAVLDGIRRL